jgi:hypothetical protein
VPLWRNLVDAPDLGSGGPEFSRLQTVRAGSNPARGNTSLAVILARRHYGGWLAVGQATTADLPPEPPHALRIGQPASREAEIELRDVPGQVLPADLMVRPVDAPLELGKVRLCDVRGRTVADVLALRVIDR